MSRSVVRTLLVDDGALDLEVLRRALSASEDLSVVGVARNGREGIELARRLDPDVICTDLEMPTMDGLGMVKEVMRTNPKPVLVLSHHIGDRSSSRVFDLLEAGAVDVLPKPSDPAAFETVITRIKILAGVRVFRRLTTRPAAVGATRLSAGLAVVAVGASTGGPAALLEILRPLGADFVAPILLVQHIAEGFLKGYVAWLDKQCSLRCEIVEGTVAALPGRVYLAREGAHLVMSGKDRVGISDAAAWSGHRPSVNHLFRSVADTCGRRSIGILLTGMGRDGAEGLKDMRDTGAMTIAQDQASSVVFGMPREAIRMNAAELVLGPDQIASTLLAQARREKGPM